MTGPLASTASPTGAAPAKIGVLIVDDSAMFRRYLDWAIRQDDGIEVVGAVESAEEAMKFLEHTTPDLITLDMNLPGKSGLAFLQEYRTFGTVPVIVVSGHTRIGAKTAIEALEAGAVDVLAKPVGVLTPSRLRSEETTEIVRRLKAVGRAPFRSMAGATKRSAATPTPANTPVVQTPEDCLIAIGTSTGGVHALETVLRSMPRNCPPIVIVQHMPAGFTKAFAKRLDSLFTIDIAEAEDGQTLRPGQALIAPGGAHHMILEQRGPNLPRKVRLIEGDPVNYSRPAVDILFASIARTCAPKTAAAVLTGMGSDGAAGLLAIRRAGGMTFAQDEATSQVYGMPARAWENGGAQIQVPLQDMAQKLLTVARRTKSTGGSPA